MKTSRLLTKGDVAVALLLLTLSGVAFMVRRAPDRRARFCEIRAGSTIHGTSLPADTAFELLGPVGKTVVRIRNHSVWVSASDCHGKHCVRSGRIELGGDVLICAPNRISVVLKGSGPGECDGITR